MVDEEKRLKVISSETPIELGEEITETVTASSIFFEIEF